MYPIMLLKRDKYICDHLARNKKLMEGLNPCEKAGIMT
jgi:hypothetical protein